MFHSANFSFSSLCVFALATLVTSQSTGGNMTSLLNWKPPPDFYQKIPQYISGFDKGGRPVIIWEFGKWQIREITSQGSEMAKAAGNYVEQSLQVIIRLAKAFEEEGGVTMLADFDGFNVQQLTHLPSVGVYLQGTRQATPIAKALYKGIAFNVNYIGQRFASFLQPFLVAVFAKSELLGTNKERWIPKLLEEIDKSQLPPQYGGNKDWKPLKILGKGEPLDLEMLRKKSTEITLK